MPVSTAARSARCSACAAIMRGAVDFEDRLGAGAPDAVPEALDLLLQRRIGAGGVERAVEVAVAFAEARRLRRRRDAVHARRGCGAAPRASLVMVHAPPRAIASTSRCMRTATMSAACDQERLTTRRRDGCGISMSPSRCSMRSASRTGISLISNRRASSVSRSRSSGLKAPSRMCSAQLLIDPFGLGGEGALGDLLMRASSGRA